MDRFKSPMHIVWITPGFASSESDNTCIPPLQIYAMWLKDRVKLTIVTLHYPRHRNKYFWHGIPVHPCRACILKGANRFLSWWNAWKKLNLINQEHPIDILHAFWMTDSLILAQRYARKRSLPVLVTAMGQDVQYRKNPFLKWVHLRNIPVVTLSEFHDKVFLKNKGISSTEIIPWGIDEPSVGQGELPDRDIDVLGVGSLIEVKDYALFIDVIAHVKREYSQIKACLIGGGPFEETLHRKIEKLNLGNTIMLTGQLSRDKVLNYMARSKILLHTSHFESQGFVFTEALREGMRIVSLPVGISRQAPWWHVAKNLNELVSGVLQMLLDWQPVLGSNYHQVHNTGQAYLTLYRGLTGDFKNGRQCPEIQD
jgi:1,2-diacylglycerol 3-alpha-glucosyltransferase